MRAIRYRNSWLTQLSKFMTTQLHNHANTKKSANHVFYYIFRNLQHLQQLNDSCIASAQLNALNDNFGSPFKELLHSQWAKEKESWIPPTSSPGNTLSCYDLTPDHTQSIPPIEIEQAFITFKKLTKKLNKLGWTTYDDVITDMGDLATWEDIKDSNRNFTYITQTEWEPFEAFIQTKGSVVLKSLLGRRPKPTQPFPITPVTDASQVFFDNKTVYIWTDGGIDRTNNFVSSIFFKPNSQYNRTYTSNAIKDNFMAELLAIEGAICLAPRTPLTIIITDSESSIKLIDSPAKPSDNDIAIRIRKMIKLRASLGWTVQLTFCYSHLLDNIGPADL
jgi:hypothetical protein